MSRIELCLGRRYFVPTLDSQNPVASFLWRDTPSQRSYYENGFLCNSFVLAQKKHDKLISHAHALFLTSMHSRATLEV